MRKITIVILGTLCVGITAIQYFVVEEKKTNDISIITNKQHNNPTVNHAQSHRLSKDKKTQVTERQLVKPIESETYSKVDEFLTSRMFESQQHLNEAFLPSEKVISKPTLEMIFSAKDFSKVIDRIRSIEKDYKSLAREEALQEKIYNLMGSKFYSEKYSCSGKICIIEFNYDSSQIENSQLESISDFGSNYSFSNFTQLANGEMKYKGLYIETDDPTSMSFNIN